MALVAFRPGMTLDGIPQGREKKRRLSFEVAFFGLAIAYFIVGIVNSGPALRPVGQRAVIVFMRV
jgi:hypothetical protein